MEEKQEIELFDWERLLMGEDLPFSFLFEVLFRSVIMFMVLLFVLRLSGKRGIKQLSIFELAIIISLGSAAGDPMFYHDVGLLPAIAVFLIVITLYKIITYIAGRVEKVEEFIEGKPIKLLEEGTIVFENFKNESLAYDELFSELRLKNVDQLGQVKQAFLETSGELSVFFFSDEDVKFGLPILPDIYTQEEAKILKAGVYACCHCGQVKTITTSELICPICFKKSWIEASKNKRIV